jgi:ubiquinone/menaquinone biosynthesis C-methylase UbiE
MTQESMQASQDPNFGRVAANWEKWEEWLKPSYRCFNRLFLKISGIKAADKVLDLGCGAGYVADLAAELVGSGGSILGIDKAQEMIDVAVARAKALRVSNVSFETREMSSLPFEEASFDVVTARFALMFVPDIQVTLSEVFRVLKKSGRLVASVWGNLEKNPLPRNVLKEYYDLPSPDLSTPGHFRFANSGDLGKLFASAGFSEVTDRAITIHEKFESPQQYIDHLLESSALWGSLLQKLEGPLYQDATKRLLAAAEEFRSGSQIKIPRQARIVSGTKN